MHSSKTVYTTKIKFRACVFDGDTMPEEHFSNITSHISKLRYIGYVKTLSCQISQKLAVK